MFSPPQRGSRSHTPESGGGNGGRSDPRSIGSWADGSGKSMGFIEKRMIESWYEARKEENELRKGRKSPILFRNPRVSFLGREWDSFSSVEKKEKETKIPLLNEYNGCRLDEETLLARIRELEDQLKAEEDLKQELENFEKENDDFVLRRNELNDEIDDYWKSLDITIKAIKSLKECIRSYDNFRTQFVAFVGKLNKCFNCGAPTTKLSNVIAEVQSGNWELKDGPLIEAQISLEREFVGLRLEEKYCNQLGSQIVEEDVSSRRNVSTCTIS